MLILRILCCGWRSSLQEPCGSFVHFVELRILHTFNGGHFVLIIIRVARRLSLSTYSKGRNIGMCSCGQFCLVSCGSCGLGDGGALWGLRINKT